MRDVFYPLTPSLAGWADATSDALAFTVRRPAAVTARTRHGGSRRGRRRFEEWHCDATPPSSDALVRLARVVVGGGGGAFCCCCWSRRLRIAAAGVLALRPQSHVVVDARDGAAREPGGHLRDRDDLLAVDRVMGGKDDSSDERTSSCSVYRCSGSRTHVRRTRSPTGRRSARFACLACVGCRAVCRDNQPPLAASGARCRLSPSPRRRGWWRSRRSRMEVRHGNAWLAPTKERVPPRRARARLSSVIRPRLLSPRPPGTGLADRPSQRRDRQRMIEAHQNTSRAIWRFGVRMHLHVAVGSGGAPPPPRTSPRGGAIGTAVPTCGAGGAQESIVFLGIHVGARTVGQCGTQPNCRDPWRGRAWMNGVRS